MDLFPIESDTLSNMIKLFDRTEKTFNEDVKTIEEWMKAQLHLPEILDPRRISNFLLMNKCSIENTKQKIDMYYTLRSLIPDMYENINPEHADMKQVLDIVYWVALPKLTKQSYRVFIFKVRNKDLIDKLEPRNVTTHIFNVHEVRMKEDHILGDVLIFDIGDLPITFLLKMTPSFLAKSIAIYEKIYSIPMKATYIVNSSPFVSKIMAILGHVLKPKLFKRIHVCEDTSILEEHLSLDLLPEDYGGKVVSCEKLHNTVKIKLRDYKARFDTLDELRVNESLRPEKLENDEILGFHGNFKKLNVD